MGGHNGMGREGGGGRATALYVQIRVTLFELLQ